MFTFPYLYTKILIGFHPIFTGTFKLHVHHRKTYLLRIINAALNEQLTDKAMLEYPLVAGCTGACPSQSQAMTGDHAQAFQSLVPADDHGCKLFWPLMLEMKKCSQNVIDNANFDIDETDASHDDIIYGRGDNVRTNLSWASFPYKWT